MSTSTPSTTYSTKNLSVHQRLPRRFPRRLRRLPPRLLLMLPHRPRSRAFLIDCRIIVGPGAPRRGQCRHRSPRHRRLSLPRGSSWHPTQTTHRPHAFLIDWRITVGPGAPRRGQCRRPRHPCLRQALQHRPLRLPSQSFNLPRIRLPWLVASQQSPRRLRLTRTTPSWSPHRVPIPTSSLRQRGRTMILSG